MHLWWFYNVSVTHLHKFVQVELPCKVLAWQQSWGSVSCLRKTKLDWRLNHQTYN